MYGLIANRSSFEITVRKQMYPLSILKTYIMKLSIYLCVFLALLISCKQETKTKEIEDKTEDIKTIISNLDTNEKKEAFLIELHDIDQGNNWLAFRGLEVAFHDGSSI